MAAAADAACLAVVLAELQCRFNRDRDCMPRDTAEAIVRRLEEIGCSRPELLWQPPKGRALEAHRAIRGGPSLGATAHPLPGPELEAASMALALLLELVRLRPEDRGLLRQRLMERDSAEAGLLWFFLRVLGNGGGEQGGGAFVHTCHLLALVVEGDEGLARVLRSARMPDLVARRLQRATEGAEHPLDAAGTGWLPFATAAAWLLEMLIAAEDSDRYQLADPTLYRPGWAGGNKPAATVDALLAALERSLLRDGGCLVAQQLHLSGLRTLGHIAHFSGQQAQRILCAGGAALGAAALAGPGADEEAANVALWFLAEVASASPLAPARLNEAGAAGLAEKALAKYPRSPYVRQEAERVLATCSGRAPARRAG